MLTANTPELSTVPGNAPEKDMAAVIRQIVTDLDLNSGYVNIADITFHSDYREICSQNVCRCYGTTWACPPGVGTEEECIARLRSYDKMLLFSKPPCQHTWHHHK